MKIVNTTFAVSKNKITVLLLAIFTIFSKIDEILGENPEIMNKNIGNPSIIRKTSTIDNSVKNEIFLIPYSTLEGLFNDTTHHSQLTLKID